MAFDPSLLSRRNFLNRFGLGLGGFARTHFGALWQLEDQGALKVESVLGRSYYEERYAETRPKI